MSASSSSSYIVLSRLLKTFQQAFFQGIVSFPVLGPKDVQTREILPVLKELQKQRDAKDSKEFQEQSFQFFTHFYRYSHLLSEDSLHNLVCELIEEKGAPFFFELFMNLTMEISQ